MSALTLDAIKETGFIGGNVEKEIEVGGNKFTVYVKPASYEHVVNVLSKQEGTERIANMISTSIVDAKGEPIFSYADIVGEAEEGRGALSSEFTVALLAVINEVSLGKPSTASS